MKQEKLPVNSSRLGGRIGMVLFLMTFLAISAASWAQEIEDALFTSLPPEERSWAEKKIKESLGKDKTLKQVDYVRLRPGGTFETTLQAGLKGLPIRPFVLLLPNMPPVTIVTEQVVLQSKGFIALSGRIQGEQDSLVSIVVRESDPSLKKDIAVYGTIFLRGRTFGISPAEKDTYAITEIDSNKLPPEAPTHVWKPKPVQKPQLPGPPPLIVDPPIFDPPKLDPHTFDPRLPHARTLSDEGAVPGMTPKHLTQTPFQNACLIDVFVAYTSAAKQEAEQAGRSIDSDIQAAIALANETYKNSNVNQRLNPVNVSGVNYEACLSTGTCYVETGTVEGDHNNLVLAGPNASPPSVPGQNSYPLTQVHTWRESLHADIFALWVKASPTAFCGASETLYEDPDNPGTFPYADVPGNPTQSFADMAAFSVVKRSCAEPGKHSMHHEFGHLGAAHHDRAYEASAPPGQPPPQAIEPDTLYSYGYALPTGAYPTGNWRTIMAENLDGNQCPPNAGPATAQCCSDCTRIPYWSNPDVKYPDPTGVATGIRDQFPPPPPLHDPNSATKEFSANNHTTLIQSGAVLSRFRWPQPQLGLCEGWLIRLDETPPAAPTGLRIIN